MSHYISPAYFNCPFYSWNSREKVHCEGGDVSVGGAHEALREYQREYCCDVNGWRRCTVARMLLRHYGA